MKRKITRRDLLITGAQAGAAFLLAGCADKGSSSPAAGITATKRAPVASAGESKIAVAGGTDPAAMTKAAIDALGGIGKFVKKGQTVVLKPNAAWARPATAAATTNPKVVEAVVQMCKEAGAGKIIIIEHAIDKPADLVFKLSGITQVAEAGGVKLISASDQSMYQTISIPKGKVITSDQCLKDVIDADVFINLPIAKSHSATHVTLGMKNLMGVIWDRQAWHNSDSLHQCIADFASAVAPTLTILDANRILLTNGPKGPGQTKDVNQVIAGVDPVAVDAYGATLFNLKPENIEHIKLACEMGLGEMDLKKVKVEKA